MTYLDRRTFLGTSAALAAFPFGSSNARTAVESPATVVKRGTAAIRGKQIHYCAEAGEIVIQDAAGVPRGTMFSVSYLAERAHSSVRPVTFIWNGGPGAASFLFREQLAPRCTQSTQASPGYTFQDNPDSLIDATDLVFIDPPGTGYSRVLDEGARAEFWGVEQDGKAFAQFIAKWLKIHNRLATPTYLMGESYGATRAAQVAKDLAARADSISLSGILLVSAAFNGGSSEMKNGPALALPSQAATAWAHGRGAFTSMSFVEVVGNARQFADGPLADALSQGVHLDDAVKVKVAKQVAEFSGLCREVVLDANLVVPLEKFRDLLLADQSERLDPYDGREHHVKPPADAPVPPMMIPGPPPEAILREELGYQASIGYQRDHVPIITGWDNTTRSEPSTLPSILKGLMAADARLRVMLVGGYFDLAVPYARPQQALLAAELPEGRFHYEVYQAGHSVYADKTVRPGATDDLRKFYRSA